MHKFIKRNHRTSSGLVIKVLIGLFTGLLLWFVWFESNKLLYAKKIECYTQFGVCPRTVMEKISGFTGTPLIQPLPYAQVRDRLKDVVEIKTIRLYRKLPYTMVLSLEMRKPVGTVGPQVLGDNVVVDDEGYAISHTDKANYPLLLTGQNYKVGDWLTGDQVTSMKLLGLMNSLSEGQIVGKITEKQLTVYFPENFSVLLDLSHITSNWYTTLQVILTRSKIQSKIPRVIDLRFSSPIVTF